MTSRARLGEVSGTDQLLTLGRRAWALVGVLVLVVAGAWVLSQVSVIVVALLLALFPAAVMSPLVERLRVSRVPDAVTALGGLLLLLLVFAVPAWLVVPRVVERAPEIADAALRGLERTLAGLSFLPDSAPDNGPEILDRLSAGDNGSALFDRGLDAVTTLTNTVTGTVLLLLILFFVIKDGRRMWVPVLGLAPARHRPLTDTLARQSWWYLGAYLRGQLLVALFDATLIGLGLWLLGVPLAFSLAVLVFFGALFPIVGSFVAGSVAVLVALADQGLAVAALVLALIVSVQMLEGNVFQPVVMSNIVGLHPLVVVLSIVAGGMVLGVFGAFVAVPTAAITGRVVTRLRQEASSDAPPSPPPG
jgi:putative heme transporter